MKIVFLWGFGGKKKNRNRKSNQAITKSYRQNQDGN